MDVNALARMIETGMGQLNVPGAGVVVVHGTDTYTAGFGVTNVNHPLNVDSQTLFQIGSVSKTFTGLLGMRLAEMGKVDLDVPIHSYLPDFRVADPATAEQVTLRHIFQHTAGWQGDWFPSGMIYGEDALERYVASMAQLEQWTAVGTILSYNNAGFVVAGRVFEVIEGKPFDQIMRDLILAPLGMTHSYYLPWEVMTQRFASGHETNAGKLAVMQPWLPPRWAGPMGGIISCAEDMLLYMRFLLGDGRTETGDRLLSSQGLRSIYESTKSRNALDSIGLTWFSQNISGTRMLWHGGQTVGQTARLSLIPEHNFALLVMTNANHGADLNEDVTFWALDHLLGLIPARPAAIEMTDATLQEYVGDYEAILSAVKVECVDSQLFVRTRGKGGFPTQDVPPKSHDYSPPIPLAFYAQDNVLAAGDAGRNLRGDFLRDPDGKIVWFRFMGRIHRRQ